MVNTILSIDSQKTDAFFSRLSSAFGARERLALVAVVHLVSNTEAFLTALDRAFDLKLIIAKRNSVDPATAAYVNANFPDRLLQLDEVASHLGDPKIWAKDTASVMDEITRRVPSEQSIAILDLGGYFSESAESLHLAMGGRLLGIVEGTENGLQKYQDHEPYSLPIFSVAGSPLKYPENHLVGVSVVYSIESVLRDHGQVLQSKRACVIGFGRVGRSAADTLRSRGVSTTVHDVSPIALAEAAALGFQVESSLRLALARANLVVCATGKGALNGESFRWLSDRTFVATVTSADDELRLIDLAHGWITRQYTLRTGRGSIVEYYDGRHMRFYLVDGGNAVNFLHGAVIGPAIRLIEAEKIAALMELGSGAGRPGLGNTVPKTRRTDIARMWLEHFVVQGTV